MQRKKFLTALAIIAAMCATMIAPAFAATTKNAEGAYVTDDENAPVQAAITKVLEMPVGTTEPEATFDFTVTPVSVDSSSNDGTNMPTVSDFSLTYPGGDDTTLGDVTSCTMQTSDIFDGVVFPHAGVYVYTVAEMPNTNAVIDANPDHEVLTYSLATYTLNVYVANKADYSGTYIYAIGDVKNTNDDGSTDGAKVDPTPGGDGVNYNYSQMAFTNVYVKTNGPIDPQNPQDPANDAATLEVSKTVDGKFGDLTLPFDYTMKITQPSLVPAPASTYTGYIIDTDGSTLNTVEFTSGVANTFSLISGQKIVFFNTPVGTAYTVNETGTSGYFGNISVVYDGGTAAATTFTDAKEGADLADTAAIPANNTFDLGNLVGEGANTAHYTNTHVDVTPTGINISDLPFYGIIALAVVGLAALVAFKVRKSRSYTR